MNQNYSPFGFLFYPFILCILFGGIYLVWQNNPALMDQLSLIEKQSRKGKRNSFVVTTAPLSTEDPERFWPTSLGKINGGQSRFYPTNFRINHRFRTAENYKSPVADGETENLAVDEKAVLFQSTRKLRLVKHEDGSEWSFEIDEGEFCDGPSALSRDFVYLCKKDGDLMALYRNSGRVAWINRSRKQYWRSPQLTDHQLLAFEVAEDKFSVSLVDPTSGEITKNLGFVSRPIQDSIALSAKHETLVYGADFTKLVAFSLKTGSKLWEVSLTQDQATSPVIFGGRVYSTGSQGVLFAHELKTGRPVWEYDIKKELYESLTVLPQLMIGTIVDAEGYLHVMDLKEGKRKWRYNMKSGSPVRALHAVRFTKSSADKLNMSDESKAWSFWGACMGNQVCAFEPIRGYLLRKYELPGPMAAAPVLIDKGRELLLAYIEDRKLKFKKYIEKNKLDLMQQAEGPKVDNPLPEN